MLPPTSATRARLATCLFFVIVLLIVAAFTANDGGQLLAQDPPRAPAKTDRAGDALPAGALARLGTQRWRHADTVTFVAFLPDGKTVLTGGLDNTLRLWDRNTGKELRRFAMPGQKAPDQGAMQAGAVFLLGDQGGGDPVPSLSHDGKIVAAAVPGNKIQLWDVATGKALRTIAGPRGGIAGFTFAPDDKTMALRGADRAIHLIETVTGKELHRIKRDKQPQGVFAIVLGGQRRGDTGRLAFAPDGKTVASAETGVDAKNQGTAFIRVVNVETGKEVRRIDQQPATAASAVAYSPDGKILAYASGNTLHLCEADTGNEIHAVKMPTGAAALLFAPDSKALAVKGADRTVRLWDAATGKEISQIGGTGKSMAARRFGGGDVRSLAFSADGKTLAIGDGNTVRFWDVGTGKEQPLAGGHRGPVSAISIAANGKTLVSRGRDNMIRAWDLADGREVSAFREPAGTTSVAVARDGKTIAYAGNGATIELFDVATGKALRELKGHANGTAFVVFAPDGKTLASAGAADNTIRLHDAHSGKALRQIVMQPNNPAMPAGAVVFGGTGTRLHLAFSADGRMLVGQFLGTSGQVIDIGGNMAGGGPAGTLLRLWDVATGQEIRKIALPPRHGTGGVAVSPDGRVVATENADGTLSLWETATGKQRLQLGQPQVAQAPRPAMMGANFVVVGGGPVRIGSIASTLVFSSDGTLLASKGPEHSVRIWDVDTGKAIGQFKGHDGAVSAVAFTRDDKCLATGSRDTTVLVWDASSLQRERSPSTADLSGKEIAERWADLASDDAAKAFQSIRRLAAHPDAAAAFLRAQLKPAVPADPKKLAKLVADLDHDNFTLRDSAYKELAQLGELALPALHKIMASKSTLETRRRAEALLAKLTGGTLTPEQLRVVRAVEVLEAAATPAARQVLETLAKGAPAVLSTREAHAALERMSTAPRR